MPKNAVLYLADPSILGARLFKRIPEIQSHEELSDEGEATGLRLKLPWGRITMSFMPGPALSLHLKGFDGYLRQVITDRENLIYALARLRGVRMSAGCIIEHKEADTEAVEDFLFKFNQAVNGLLFLYDSIFDFTGEALGGPEAEDPSNRVTG